MDELNGGRIEHAVDLEGGFREILKTNLLHNNDAPVSKLLTAASEEINRIDATIPVTPTIKTDHLRKEITNLLSEAVQQSGKQSVDEIVSLAKDALDKAQKTYNEAVAFAEEINNRSEQFAAMITAEHLKLQEIANAISGARERFKK